MKDVKLQGHKIMLYNSIDELPMVRFHKFNKCLLVDAGIGSDLAAFDNHIERAVRFIKSDKRTEASTELENLRNSVMMILQELSPSDMAFACMVAAIDGKPMDDLSDEGLQKVLSILGDITKKDMTASSDAVKKKIDDELTAYFPALFDDVRTKEFYDNMRERALLQLQDIINGKDEDRDAAIERLTDMLITYSKPRKFAGSNNAEIEYDKQFEDMCLIISQNLHRNAKEMTVMEYYNAYQYIEKQQRRQKTQNKSR